MVLTRSGRTWGDNPQDIPPGWVWVTCSRDKEPALFQLCNHGRYIPFRQVATHFHLDKSSTLRLGDAAFSVKSNIGIDTFRAMAAGQNLGNGFSRETPFIITGKSVVPVRPRLTLMPAAPSEQQQQSMMQPGPTEQPKSPAAAAADDLTFMKKKVAAAALPWDEFKGLPVHNRIALQELRQLLFQAKEVAERHHLIESETGVHHYKFRIGSALETLGESVATMVGTVHIVLKSTLESAEGTLELLSNHPATGMVTLVRPEGLCLTALSCIGNLNKEGFTIVVNFPRLTGDVVYECKIIRVYCSAVVHLETVEKQVFSACMATGSPRARVYMFDGSADMKLVDCFHVGYQEHPLELLVLPTSPVDTEGAVGGPVFNHGGELIGVVIDASNLLQKPGGADQKCVSRTSGRKLPFQYVSDLEPMKKEEEVWMNIHDSLGNSNSESAEEFECWTNGLDIGRLVEVVPGGFKSVSEDWREENPLNNFVEQVTTIATHPGFNHNWRRNAPSACTGTLSEEACSAFYAQQNLVYELSEELDNTALT